MKTEFTRADFQPIGDFALIWRWTQQSHNIFPPEVLAAIHPLTEAKAEELWVVAEQLHKDFDALPNVDPSNLSGGPASRNAIDTSGDDIKLVQDWLHSRPVEDDPDVLIVWRFFPGCGVLSKWRTFCQYWDDFCYPASDDVAIWPLYGSWAVVYRHFEVLRFAEQVSLAA